MKPFTLATIFLVLIGVIGSCSKDANAPSAAKRGASSRELSSAAVSVTAIAPVSGITYTAITITGGNFDTVKTNNMVKINGVTALVNSATSSQLVVTVQPGSTTGAVTVTTGGKSASAPTDFKVLQVVKIGAITFNDQIDITSFTSDNKGSIYLTGHSYTAQGYNQDNIYKYANGGLALLYKAIGWNDGSVTLTNLVADSQNNIYAGDNYYTAGDAKGGYPAVDSAKILKITPAGQVSVFAGGDPTLANSDGSDPMSKITNIIADQFDNIYVVGLAGQGEVKKITLNGVISTFEALNGNTSIQQLTKDKLGNLYFVSEITGYNIPSPYYSVQKKTPNGAITTILNTNTAQITALITDASNNVYVTSYPPDDEGYNVLNIINQAGVVHTIPTKYGVALSYSDNLGNLYTTQYTGGDLTLTKYSLQ
jgi:hypothetical protein